MKRFFINAAILVVALLVIGLLSGNWPAAIYIILICITSMLAGYDAARPWVLKKEIGYLEADRASLKTIKHRLENKIDDLEREVSGLNAVNGLLNKEVAYLRSEKNEESKVFASMQVDNTSGFVNQANAAHNKMLALNKAIEMKPSEVGDLLESADKILKWLNEQKA